jgi:hypothetical protein
MRLSSARGPEHPAVDEDIPRSLPVIRVDHLFVITCIVIGASLRLYYYVSNPSMSVDEASLALNVMHRSYSNLLGRLDFNQAAPAGFLLLQKLVVDGFGATPYAFRLVPLLAGIASMLLIYPVAARIAGVKVAMLALALVAFSEPLISYASTNKQYSLDVAVALGLYMFALVLPPRIGTREAVLLGLSGAISVWLSHPAAFVLAAIGTVLIIESAASRNWSYVMNLAVVGTVWIASFLAAYAVTRSSIEQVQNSIAGGSPSLISASDGQPSLAQKYGGVVRNLLGVPTFGHGLRSAIAVVGILLGLVGIIVLLRARTRSAALLVLPAGIAVIASILHLYPYYPRTFLFLIPGLVVLVSVGACFLIVPERSRLLAFGSTVGITILFGATLYAAIDRIQSTTIGEPARALEFLAQKARPGDSLYVSLSAQYDFRYYLECGCFAKSGTVAKAKSLWPIRPTSGHAQFAPALRSAPPQLIAGIATGKAAADYRSDFRPLRGRKRVWILLIDASPQDQQGLEALLNEAGIRRDSFPRAGNPGAASVSLFDLRGLR